MKNSLLTLAVLFGVFSATQVFARGGGSSVGPANPAALNCEKLGGKVERVTSPIGEGANCAIEQWLLFGAMSDRGLVCPHPRRDPSVGMPNPAAVNCLDVGGELRVETDSTGESVVCVVEQWTLFNAIDVTQEP